MISSMSTEIDKTCLSAIPGIVYTKDKLYECALNPTLGLYKRNRYCNMFMLYINGDSAFT